MHVGRLRILSVLSLGLPAAALAQCPPEWLRGTGAPVTNGTIRAATLYDPDGDGPATPSMVIAGNFSDVPASFSSIRNIARWTGVTWEPMGIRGFDNSGALHALAVFDLDGAGPNPPRVIVGGQFSVGFGGNTINNIASTDGGYPERMSNGLNGVVRALHVFDPDGDGPIAGQLFAGGLFSGSGQVNMRGIARWNGTQWEAIASPLSGTGVNALATIDLDGPGPLTSYLAAGGRFSASGQISNIAFYDGTAWVRLGSVDDEVLSLAVYDFDGSGPSPARIVAGGRFRASGAGVQLNGQAYYTGSSWQPVTSLPQFPPPSITSVGVLDPDGTGGEPGRLFFAGSIPRTNGPAVRLIEAVGGEAVVIANSAYAGDIVAMPQLTPPGEDAPALLVLGNLFTAQPPTPLQLGTIRGQSVSPLFDGFNNVVSVMTTSTVTGSERVFVAGNFTRSPGGQAGGIAMFDGATWSSVGGHTGNTILGEAIIAFDPDDAGPEPERLIVGGAFHTIAGVPVQNVAMFDGASWSTMGGGLPSSPRGFAAFDPDGPSPKRLFASGGIVPGGPGTPGHIYRWSGKEWAAFGPEFVSNSGPPQTMLLTSFDPDGAGLQPRQLVVIGNFDRVGSVAAENIAAFDGSVWRPLGGGFSNGPTGLFTWDPNGDGHEVVLVGGGTRLVNGVPTHGIAMWNGTTWSTMGDQRSGAAAFAIFDGSLHAVGGFLNDDGEPVSAVARWTGDAWQVVTETLDDTGSAVCAAVLPGRGGRPETLCLGGYFQSAGSLPNAFFARLAMSACCPADINGDGMVMSDDLFAFLDVFMSETEGADFNADKSVNSQDFFDFLGAFFSGC